MVRQKTDRLEQLRNGQQLSTRELLLMALQLSIPAILAQISSIIMEYIDASMVGHLGSAQAASIGLVSSSTWLFGSMCSAVNVGFTVQIAHAIGAGNEEKARGIVRQGLVAALILSVLLSGLGVYVSFGIPAWLGADEAIRHDATMYFMIFALCIPAMQLRGMAGSMLQCSGNMTVPSVLMTLECALDVIFNALLIFRTRKIVFLGAAITIPGAGLGVMGASMGTGLAEIVTAVIMLFFLLVRSEPLHLRKEERLHFVPQDLKNALRIGTPVAFEQIIMCGAQVMSTRIVSPLGTIAIAANSFAVIVESLCYMPGYGISSAATTLVGQSIGAKRQDVTKKLGWLVTGLGMFIMGCTAVLMYFIAPFLIGLLSPDPAIRELGTTVLRIVVFVEPLYAASIVATGVFRGAGDTLAPSIMNFVSMWCVRLPIAAVLSVRIGLRGVWIAMSIELAFRGIIFLIRLSGKRWQSSFR